MMAIIDYGLGNIRAFCNIYSRLNIRFRIASKVADLDAVDKIVLPGVGAFDWAMRRLDQSGMRNRLDELVMKEKRPILGVCVGMQIMANRSEEGVLEGLRWIDGEVRRFDEASFIEKTHLPHMGWNDVEVLQSNDLFQGLDAGARFYFLHSYYLAPRHKSNVLAMTDYNGPYASSVRSENVFGVQFHPEKSHGWGIQLLKNFAEL